MADKRKGMLLKSLDFVDLQISRFESFVLAIGVMMMAINTVIAVISRFVFNDAMVVTAELNQMFIVLVTFAGISYAARQGRHIRMSAIYDALPTSYRKVLMIIMAFSTAIIMFALCFFSIQYNMSIYENGRMLITLGIPAYFMYLWVPIGFFVTGIQYSLTVVTNFREKDVYLSTNVIDGYYDINTDIEV
jgi:TRAP-type C4-dicarboxylate transport system permease small subunit